MGFQNFIVINKIHPLKKAGVASHVKSDYARTIVNIHPLTHVLGSCALISVVAPVFYGLPQPHHVTGGLSPLSR